MPVHGPGRADRPAAADHRRDDRGRGGADAGRRTSCAACSTSVAVVTPEFGERRARVLEDLALLTGGMPIDGRPRADAGGDPARAARAGASAWSWTALTTTILDGRGGPAGIDAADRRSSAPRWRSAARRTSTRASSASGMARLVGGVAVIKVGAATETEMHERRHRVEDAVQAARAARTEGIVAGRRRGAAPRAQAAIDAAGLRARRGDRRRDRAARAGGAAAPDRRATPGSSRRPRSRASRRWACARGSTRRPACTAICSSAGVFDPVMVTRGGAGATPPRSPRRSSRPSASSPARRPRWAPSPCTATARSRHTFGFLHAPGGRALRRWARTVVSESKCACARCSCAFGRRCRRREVSTSFPGCVSRSTCEGEIAL